MKKNLSLNKEFESVILSFHYKLVGKFHEEARRRGFTSSQLEVLRYIGEKGAPTMKEIARHLGITPPSVTNIIETLCRKNFLKRELDKKDKRIARIIFAPKLWKYFSNSKEKRLLVLKDAFASLEAKDKKELIRIITKLTKE